jgi:hypothetical protein
MTDMTPTFGIQVWKNRICIVAEMIRRRAREVIVFSLVYSLAGFCPEKQSLASEIFTSAWRDGHFQVDVSGVVGRRSQPADRSKSASSAMRRDTLRGINSGG